MRSPKPSSSRSSTTRSRRSTAARPRRRGRRPSSWCGTWWRPQRADCYIRAFPSTSSREKRLDVTTRPDQRPALRARPARRRARPRIGAKRWPDRPSGSELPPHDPPAAASRHHLRHLAPRERHELPERPHRGQVVQQLPARAPPPRRVLPPPRPRLPLPRAPLQQEPLLLRLADEVQEERPPGRLPLYAEHLAPSRRSPASAR